MEDFSKIIYENLEIINQAEVAKAMTQMFE
jgi:hypothetical protein